MRRLIMCALLFALSAASQAAAVDFDAYVYWVTPGTKKAVAWTAPDTGADGFEIYVWQLENSKSFLAGRLVQTNSIEITWRTHGHYIIYCRAFKVDAYGAKKFSEWVNTLDPTVGEVNGKPRAWVLYVAPY